MMKSPSPHLLIASISLLPLGACFSIVTTDDAAVLASAIFNDPGLTILQASFTGASYSSGTFSDGPFGISSGAILTSGAAIGALPYGDHYVNNGAPGSDQYCNSNTFNGAILTVDILVNPPYSGMNVEFIMASEEEGGSADPIGIFVGGTQYAVDENGNRITAQTNWLAPPRAIFPPNSLTSYPGSTPPFIKGIPASGATNMVIAICDQSDSEWDSALLIRARGCTDCDTDFRLDYVTTTTTVGPGETTFTSTAQASGTVSGTITIGVTATTTTDDATTTTSDDATTTTTSADSTSTDSSITSDTATTSTTFDSSTTSISISSSTSSDSSTPLEMSSTSSSMITTDSTAVETTPTSATSPVRTITGTLSESTTSLSTEDQSQSVPTSEDVASSMMTRSQPTTTPSSTPQNLPNIGQYKFVGCLGSTQGYPDFQLVASAPDMTTRKCVSLNKGRRYVGMFDRSCYVSDSLTSTALVLNAQCDRPCPGEPRLFCGGVIDLGSVKHRRDAPPNILLTLYELAALQSESSSGLSSTSDAQKTSSTITRPSITPAHDVTETVVVTGVATTIQETIVTTITYTIVDPQDPTRLTVTELCTTLEYHRCNMCKHQSLPVPEMTTFIATCNACGSGGASTVTLTVPLAAITSSGNPHSPGKIGHDSAGANLQVADDTSYPAAEPVRPGSKPIDIKPTKGSESGPYQASKTNGFGSEVNAVPSGYKAGVHSVGSEFHSPQEGDKAAAHSAGSELDHAKEAYKYTTHQVQSDQGASEYKPDEPAEEHGSGSGANIGPSKDTSYYRPSGEMGDHKPNVSSPSGSHTSLFTPTAGSAREGIDGTLALLSTFFILLFG